MMAHMGGYSPWGPHGGTGNPHEVRPNPTPSYVPPPWNDGGGWAPAPTQGGSGGGGGYSGGGYGGGTPYHAGFIVSGILLLCVWELWLCLYPLAAVGGIAAAYGAALALLKSIPPQPGDAIYSMVFLPAAVAGLAAVVLSRIEHRLARLLVYRLARHIVRLGLIALLTVRYYQEAMGYAAFPEVLDLRVLRETDCLATRRSGGGDAFPAVERQERACVLAPADGGSAATGEGSGGGGLKLSLIGAGDENRTRNQQLGRL